MKAANQVTENHQTTAAKKRSLNHYFGARRSKVEADIDIQRLFRLRGRRFS